MSTVAKRNWHVDKEGMEKDQDRAGDREIREEVDRKREIDNGLTDR